jgi:hypothetical protein
MQKQRDPIARAIAQESDKVNYVKFDRIGKMVSEQEYYDSLSWGQKGHFTRHKRAMQREERQKNRELSHSVVAMDAISKTNSQSSQNPSPGTLAALKAHATRRKNKELLEQSVDNSVLVDKNNVSVDINNVSPRTLSAYKAHATMRRIKGGRKYKIIDDKSIPFIKNTLSGGGKKIFLEVTPISPRTLAAYKAHDTRRKNKELEIVSDNENPSVKLWNGPGKTIVRNQVVERFNKYGSGYTLALESEQLLFVNALPNHNFAIFEQDPKIFDAIKKNKPSNIRSLVNADIGTAKNDKAPYDYAFLDFCNTYVKNVPTLKSLAKVLKKSKVIALTFAIRGHKSWNHGDYQTDISVRLRSIFKNHEVVYGKGYKDGKHGANMFGIILEHKDVGV